MKDFLGNELSVGDKIVFVTHTQTSSWLKTGEIKRISAKRVYIQDDTYRDPNKVVKVV